MSINDKHIVKYHLRYALLRCGKYTDNKQDAETLAIHTLLSTCVLLRKSKHSESPGLLIDRLISLVHSVLKNAKKLADSKTEKLLPDERLSSLSKALNSLDDFERQVLVLYYIEMMSTKEISQLYNKSIPDIRTSIIHGETDMVKHFSGLWTQEPTLSEEDVCLWLDELAEALPTGSRMKITDTIESYLQHPKKERSIIQKYLDLYNTI